MKITRKLLLDMDRQLKLTAQGDITVTSFRLTRKQREELGNLAYALSLESDFRVTPSLVIRTLIYIALQEFNPGVLYAPKAAELHTSEEDTPLDIEETLPEILDTALEPDLEPAVQSEAAGISLPGTSDLGEDHSRALQKLLNMSLGAEGLEIMGRVNSADE